MFSHWFTHTLNRHYVTVKQHCVSDIGLYYLNRNINVSCLLYIKLRRNCLDSQSDPWWYIYYRMNNLMMLLTYKSLYYVGSHSQCDVSCVHMRETLQSVNVLLNGYECDDASCFVASETNNNVLFRVHIHTQI